MIRVIETQMPGEAHFIINLAITKIFTQDENFIFIGEKAQISALEKRIKIPNKKFIKVQHFAKKWQLPFYVLYHFFVIVVQLLQSKSKDTLVFTSLFPVTHFLVKYSFFLSPAKKVIVLHGELKYIDAYTNSLLKTLGVFLKSALLHKVKNLEYIVLGENIKEIVVQKKWLDDSEVRVIEHPYDFDHIVEKNVDPHIIKLANIGSASISKGSNWFIELARMNTNPTLVFEIIGAISDVDLLPILHDKILYSKDRFIDSTSYNKLLSTSSIAVFFLDEKDYAYTASGAFLDAVKYRIPVLALRNRYFENYFRKYGEIGILFDTKEELQSFILKEDLKNILQENSSKWENNFLKIIEKNTI